MTRRPMVVGNWKMHTRSRGAVALAREVRRRLATIRGVDVVLCPPFTALAGVGHLLHDRGPRLGLGAQTCHWEPQGAFTGEIALGMLRELGVRYSIIGHSERRAACGETNDTVARKVQAALAHAIVPIVCVGETWDQRQAGRTLAVVEEQLRVGLHPVASSRAARLVIAYEPVWAIGTGQQATPAQAQEAQAFIRRWLAERFSPPAARAIRIQYGGSVNPDNAPDLMAQPDVDGFLVGGASLNAEGFCAIVKTAAGRPISNRVLKQPGYGLAAQQAQDARRTPAAAATGRRTTACWPVPAEAYGGYTPHKGTPRATLPRQVVRHLPIAAATTQIGLVQQPTKES